MTLPTPPPCRLRRLERGLWTAAALSAIVLGLGTGAGGAAAQASAPPRLESITSEPADLPEYLSYWQARAHQRALANARPATLNQASYDVHYYNLDLHPDTTMRVLTGKVRMLASVVAGPIATVELDLDDANMTCTAASVAGLGTTFSQGGGILTVQLDRAYDTGEMIDVTVNYHGSPNAGAFGAAFGFDRHGSAMLISTLSEPFDARTWWPCKDDPSDKADSADVGVTLPSGFITAGNGVRTQYVDNGTTAFSVWHERHPISTYLISIASFPYTVVSDWYHPTPADSMEIRFHLFPETVAPAAAVHAKVKTMIAADVAKFGPYPFLDEKYGHAQFLWGGGMENQTCTSLGAFSEYIVAHELSHQWWGDAVTCRDFHHIWLNEGFATFCEAIWAEYNTGLAGFHSRMNGYTYYGAGSVYVPDVGDPSRIFSSALSYKKGAWVLAMLRHVLGDANFFLAMRTYLAQHYYGTATTEDFQATCEQVSGINLTKFFQQWVYGEYYPKYVINSGYVAAPGGGYDVTLQIKQTQTWQMFWMPLDVSVNTATTSFRYVVQDSTPLQLFSFHVPDPPTSVLLDPDNWVLRTVMTITGVDAPGVASAVEFAAPRPNPTRGETTFDLSLPREGDVDIDVIDAAGRRVARVQHGVLQPGPQSLRWNGRGDGGRALQPGVYWVRLAFEGQHVTRRIALLN